MARADSTSAALAAASRVTTGATVTVACKLPNGLNLGRIHGADKPEVVLRGSNHRFAAEQGGYGLTHGVSADAFAKWCQDHKFLPALQSNLIFAHSKPLAARAMAVEMGSVKSGLEPLNGDDPSADERTASEMTPVEPTDAQKKANDKTKAENAEALEEARRMAEEPEDQV
jgi:hypothetical protein